MSAERRHRAFAERIRFHAGSAEEIAIDSLSGVVRVLSAEQARVLAACHGSRTLDEHAAEATRRLGERGPGPAVVRALVETLAWKGLLVDEAALLADVARAARPPLAPAAIATIGIPTCGRPERLAATVRAHDRSARAAGRAVTFVIADSSRDDDAAEATRTALHRLASEGVSIRVADRAARAAFADVLAERSGVDRAIVDAALLGDPRLGVDTGANHNALLLDAAGEAHLHTDDDVTPRAVQPEGAREGVALVAGDPCELWFRPPEMPLIEADRWCHPDTLSLHERVLGADVARIASEAAADSAAHTAIHGAADSAASEPADSSAASASMFRRLVRRGGRVLVTQLGSAGDHGMAASFGLLLTAGPSRARLLASEAIFRSAYEGRRVLRAPTRIAIAEGAPCLSMSMAIDARDLVPPFPSSGRDSDGLFGALLRVCVPDSFTAHLPWAAEHVPPSPRATSIDAEVRAAGRAAPNELIRALLGATFDARDPSPRRLMERAGASWVLLAARPDDADLVLREQVMRGLARRLTQIDRALAEAGRALSFWSGALTAFAAALRSAITSDHPHLPPELVAAHGPVAARSLLLEHIATTGRVLAAWPRLFDAARSLRAEGRRLSRALS
ncbi:MAG: hypothetical protein U0441_33520 [Polyangiaceae bacterium]